MLTSQQFEDGATESVDDTEDIYITGGALSANWNAFGSIVTLDLHETIFGDFF